MKQKLFLLLFLFLVSANVFAGDDDMLVTRDGTITPVKIVKISTQDVTYLDLSKKKRQRTAATSFVYMIMKEKGNNIFFDEEGNQMTSPVVKFDKKDNVMFTNDGKIFPIYEVSIGKDAITYKLQGKKKAPVETKAKSEVFMIRNADGTSTVFTAPTANQQEKSLTQAPVANNTYTQPVAMPVVAKQTVANTPMATANAPQANTAMTQELLEKNAQTIANFNARQIPYDGEDEGKKYSAGKGGILIYKYAFTPNSILENNDLIANYYIVDYYTSQVGGDKVVDIKVQTDRRKAKGWRSRQGLGMSLTNKTNRVIFVDLGNSYLSQAGESKPYYTPSATSVTKGTSSGVGVNMGSVAGALGVGGALGTLASGVNVGGGTSTETTHITYSQRVVSIPPRSTVNLEPKRLTDDYCHQVGLYIMRYLYNDKQREFKGGIEGKSPEMFYGELFDLPGNKSPLLSTFITYGYDENLSQSTNMMADLYISQLLVTNSGFDPYSMPLYFKTAARYGKTFIREVTGE